MAKTNSKQISRLKRKKHIKKTIRGTAQRPRLSIFRSARHIYAQIINDETGETLVSASSLKSDGGSNREAAAVVGKSVAAAAKSANVDTVVFDRNGYLYHGRVAALAEAAREAGLKF